MTDRERIKVLEKRVDFLEVSLEKTLRQLDRLTDVLIKASKQYEIHERKDE